MSSSSLSRRSSVQGRGDGDGEGGIVARLAQSEIVQRGRAAADQAAGVAWKLLRSTGKAAWYAGTTFLVLVVPLIIEMDREQQMNELEMQQASLLGTPPPSIAGVAGALPPPSK